MRKFGAWSKNVKQILKSKKMIEEVQTKNIMSIYA